MKKVLDQLAELARSYGHDETRFKSEARKVLEGFASKTKERAWNEALSEMEEVPVVDDVAVARDRTVMAAFTLDASRDPGVRKARSQVFRSICLKSNTSLKVGEKRLGKPVTFVLPTLTPAGTRTFFIEQFVAWQTEQDASNAPFDSVPTTKFAYVSQDPTTIGQVVDHLVPDQGLLAEIVRAGRDLADKYGWGLEDAVTFILCGKVPEFGSVGAMAQLDRRFPARSRLILWIDPHLDADTVARVYLSARRYIGGQRAKGHRVDTIAKVERHAARLSGVARMMHMSRSLSSIAALQRPTNGARYPARAVRDILDAGLDLKGVLAANQDHELISKLMLNGLDRFEAIVRAAFKECDLDYDELTRLRLESLEPNVAWDLVAVLIVDEVAKLLLDLAASCSPGTRGVDAIKAHVDLMLSYKVSS